MKILILLYRKSLRVPFHSIDCQPPCSDSFFFEILERQKQNPVCFQELVKTHARCEFGCGSCKSVLKEYLINSNQYFD